MSQPISQNGWTWDPRSKRWYYYDRLTDEIVYEDNRRVPRTPYAAGTSQQTASQTQTTGHNAHYVIESPAYQPAQQQISNTSNPTYQSVRNSYSSFTPLQTVTEGVSSLTLAHQPQQYRSNQTSRGPPQSNPNNQAEIGPDDPQRFVSGHDQDGIPYTSDRYLGITTRVQTAPQRDITDPALWNIGIPARARLLPSAGDNEKLFESFQKRPQPRNYFILGRVFITLWTEPAGGTGLEPGTHRGRYGERVFSKVRRFVVIRAGDNYCSCLPIVSHNDQGVSKPGVRKSDFSIIYTGKAAPDPIEAEKPKPGEAGMRRHSIRVVADDPTDKLSQMSRLDYGQVSTVHHHVKVKNFGIVHPHSMRHLEKQFDDVWNKQSSSTQSQPPIQPPSTATHKREASRDSKSSKAPATSPKQEPRDRRDSHAESVSDRIRSQGESSGRQIIRPRTLSRSDQSKKEESDGEESPDAELQGKLREAVARLVQRGFSREQAVSAVKDKLAQQASAIEEESDESSTDTDGQRDSRTTRSGRSRDDQPRVSRSSKDQAQRSRQVRSQSRPKGSEQRRGGASRNEASSRSHRKEEPEQQRSTTQDTRGSRSQATPSSSAAAARETAAEREEALIQHFMRTRRCNREQAKDYLRRQRERNDQ